jgi:DNA-binding transcriptional LysR family regulator
MFLLFQKKVFLMDTRYLKSLLAVVDCGSIVDAARTEGVTAAAVSQRMQVLERSLGFALLSRVGHSVKATEACVALLPRARHIVSQVALLAGDADSSGLTGSLRIGAISTMLAGLLPSALLELSRLAPGIKTSILPGTSRSLYLALQNGELDAAVIVAPPFELPKMFRVAPLHVEKLVLAAKGPAQTSTAEVLQSNPYICYEPSSWGGLHAQRYLDDHGLALKPLFSLDGLEAIAMLVANGVGASLMPLWSGLEQMAKEFTITPVGPGYDREIVLVTLAHTDRPRMLEVLLQALAK